MFEDIISENARISGKWRCARQISALGREIHKGWEESHIDRGEESVAIGLKEMWAGHGEYGRGVLSLNFEISFRWGWGGGC